MGYKELVTMLQQTEKITLKLLIDGEEIGEIDMGIPIQDTIYREQIGWYMSTSPKIPCQPYKMEMGDEMVSYYYPYRLTLTVTRGMREEEKKAMRLEVADKPPEENPEVAVPNDF